MESWALLLASTLNAGTVLALAALGLLINEKAGVVNLGAEGIMLCAALAGFACVIHTGSDWLGFAAGMSAGALLAALLGVLVIWLGANQYAAGLALSLFGAGLSAFAGAGYVQARLPDRPRFDWLGLGDIPFIGAALMRHHPLVYLSALLAAALAWLLWRTRAGLVLRAVGESPVNSSFSENFEKNLKRALMLNLASDNLKLYVSEFKTVKSPIVLFYTLTRREIGRASCRERV